MELEPSHAENERIPEPVLEPNAVNESQVGQWCVVPLYLGIKQNVDMNDIKVKFMHRIGANTFVDTCWKMSCSILTAMLLFTLGKQVLLGVDIFSCHKQSGNMSYKV